MSRFGNVLLALAGTRLGGSRRTRSRQQGSGRRPRPQDMPAIPLPLTVPTAQNPHPAATAGSWTSFPAGSFPGAPLKGLWPDCPVWPQADTAWLAEEQGVAVPGLSDVYFPEDFAAKGGQARTPGTAGGPVDCRAVRTHRKVPGTENGPREGSSQRGPQCPWSAQGHPSPVSWTLNRAPVNASSPGDPRVAACCPAPVCRPSGASSPASPEVPRSSPPGTIWT